MVYRERNANTLEYVQPYMVKSEAPSPKGRSFGGAFRSTILSISKELRPIVLTQLPLAQKSRLFSLKYFRRSAPNQILKANKTQNSNSNLNI